MKIQFDTPITDLDGKTVANGQETLTVKTVALNALMAMLQDEQNVAGDEKARRFELALRVHKGGEQDLKPEEVASLKKLIGKCYGPLVVGRAYEVLNG